MQYTALLFPPFHFSSVTPFCHSAFSVILRQGLIPLPKGWRKNQQNSIARKLVLLRGIIEVLNLQSA